MFGLRNSLVVAASATITLIGIITVVMYFIIRRRLASSKVDVTQPPQSKTTALIPQLDPKRRVFHSPFFQRGILSSTNKMVKFNWDDHPSLITDAVENGWSRFAFTHYYNYNTSSSVRSSLFSSLRSTNNDSNNNNNRVEENWEVGLGSADLMQRLDFKIANGGSTSSAKSMVRMTLPLPGPRVTNSFPEEAYFEITVVDCFGGKGMMMRKGNSRDWEKAKLLSQQSDSSVISGMRNSPGLGHVSRREKEGGMMKAALGLSVGGVMTSKVPGSYPGSIGFYSDGSVFLSGMKLVFETEKEDWAQTGKVIGCGFDPSKKKVFFTVDSELVHVVHCKSEDFAMPLYPVLAANIDITILVNLGQSSFGYAPANAQRTANPCFTSRPVGQQSSPESLGYDDSREFFSMGRLDSQWLTHSATARSVISNNSNHNNYYSNNNNRNDEYDEESEAELFEIVLDST